ncbi:MAG: DUF21 domain-containing protein [Candidatus Omnitrophica bacterium]|nr:DUF21 domain-containing protein [Candidatus Omnitrophota bacterium]
MILSIFFSISEMAFVSLNKAKIKEMADKGSLAAEHILWLQHRPDYFLTLILIGNNIVNAVATSIVTYLLQVLFGLDSEWVITAIMAPLLIVLCEVVPKNYGRLRAHPFMFRFSGILELLMRIFEWPIKVCLKVVDALVGEASHGHKSIFVSEDEFRSLIEESAKTGVLEPHEKKMIDTILDFERIRLDAVMTPFEKVAKVEIQASVKDARAMARKTKARFLLVYEEIPTLIIGSVYTYDLLFEADEKKKLKEFLRSPVFLSANTSIEKAFLTLKHKRQSFAVVTDPAGEAVGVTPIENLLVL